jgi:hypothetical protein
MTLASTSRTGIALVALGLAVTACGGAKQPAAPSAPAPAEAPPPAKTDEKDAAPKAAGPVDVPTSCETKDGYCLPPFAFGKKLCSGFHPEVALAFFQKGTPWTRAYLKGDVEAVNASGGSSSGGKLAFDEEVLVMVRRKADAGGVQVSGAGDGFDVLRWDGTCSTLSAGEITTQAPPKPKAPKLLWKDVPEAAQAKLLEDASIAKINGERKKECKGVTLGDVSDKCVKAVDQLSIAIVKYVRDGGAVPTPPPLP